MGLPNLTRGTKLSGANEEREKSVFPVQLTTSRIGNHTWLIPSLLKVMTTQGCTLSATLFKVFINYMIRAVEVAKQGVKVREDTVSGLISRITLWR